jgi:CubicO group peptidase (beta-lactamase class C family)
MGAPRMPRGELRGKAAPLREPASRDNVGLPCWPAPARSRSPRSQLPPSRPSTTPLVSRTLVARHRALVAAGACLVVAALPSRSAAQAPPPALGDSARVAINRVFASWTTTDGPGCAVGVSRDGRVVFENGYGMANLEHGVPNTPASIFHVASVSKQFTAAAIALLARDGKLSLDDDVRKHIPELPDYGHRLTIRHLLTHTSGLRDQWDLLFMARGRFEENRITEDDVLEIVTRQKALNFTPGTEYLYSNTGYTLAAVIVRRASGTSLRAFADERMFRPLGMTQTHFHDDYTMVVKGRAAGYARGAGTAGGTWRVSLPNYDTYGATSLFSTVGDLLKWAANFDRPIVGDTALLRGMGASATLADGDTTGYGLGLATERYRGAWLVGHGGADAGYRTYLGRFPQHGVAIAVLCNAAQAVPVLLAYGVADAVLGDRLAAPDSAPRAGGTVASAELARHAGVYVHPATGAPTYLTMRGDTLVRGRATGPALVPQGNGRFRIGGQEIAFTPAGDMVVTGLGWPARRPVTYKRQPEAKSTPAALRAALRAYAGSYRSDELLGATYTVRATDSTLVVRTRGGRDVTMLPAFGDTFAGPNLLLGFTRDRGGRVNGVEMSSGRVRRLRLERVDPSHVAQAP